MSGSAGKTEAQVTAQPTPNGGVPNPDAVGPSVPSDPRRAIISGLIVLAVTFGGFGTWAAVAQLSSAVVSHGTVKVFSNRKKIQHLEGGIVEEIMVRNGDTVKEGDVLLRLDKTQSAARAEIIHLRYFAAQAAVARLEAELEDAEEIAFPPSLDREKPEVADILDGQIILFEARRSTLTGEVGLLEERKGQLQEEIRGLRAQVASRNRQLKLITEELKGLNELLEKGYASRTRVLALEREAARLRGERGAQEAAIARAKRLIGEAELQIIQVRQTYREKVVAELREQRGEMMDLQERKQAADVMLDRTDMRAPVTGLVVGLAVHAKDQVIRAGETIMEIVPTDDVLIVEAPVRPIDRDDVLIGLPADVLFTAFSYRTTPKLKGEVVYISADSMIDEKTGASYYLTRVAVPDDEVKRLGKQRLQPGMPADVFIKTGARTPLNYLIKPLTDSLGRAWREK